MAVLSVQFSSRWSKAKSILIVPTSEENGDTLYASLALFLLGLEANKQSQFYAPRLFKSVLRQEKIPQAIRPFLVDKLAGRISLSLPDETGWDIKNAKIVEEQNTKSIQLEGAFPASLNNQVILNIKTEPKDYDLYLIIGSKKSRDSFVSDLLIGAFMPEKCLRICLTNSVKDTPNISSEAYTLKEKSFAAGIHNMFHTHKLNISPDIATLLLAGIYSYTNKVTQHLSLEVFEIIANLIKSGAVTQKAVELNLKDYHLGRMQALGQMLYSLEALKNGAYLARVNLNNPKLRALKIKDLSALKGLYHFKIGFVFLQVESEFSANANIGNKVLITAVAKSNLLKEAVQLFSGKLLGNQAIVNTNLDYEQFRSALVNLLATNTD